MKCLRRINKLMKMTVVKSERAEISREERGGGGKKGSIVEDKIWDFLALPSVRFGSANEL